MIDRRQRDWLFALAIPLVSACAAPEALDSSAGSIESTDATDATNAPDPAEMSRLIAERMELAASGRYLAAPSNGSPSAATLTGQQLVDALDIPAALRPTFVSATIPDPNAVVIRSSYGRILPRSGTSFLLLSTGRSNIDTLPAEPGTDMGPIGTAGDASTLRVQVTVPPGVNRLSFDYDFLSAESPDFIGSPFNDTFTARVSDALGANRQVALASVNTATFHPASETNVGPGPFLLYVDNPDGVDTVFNSTGLQLDAGATDYQHVDTAIAGGAGGVITIDFSIQDLGDGIFDSAIILDNFSFSAMEVVDPRSDMRTQSLIGNDGQVLQAPDPRLVTLGKPVQTVAADGATQVVLRSSVPGPGKATFALPAGGAKDGSVSPAVGSPSWSASTTVDAQLIGGTWYAIALYQSPPDFNRGGDELLKRRDAALTMTYAPTTGTGFVQDVMIGVVRPPVIVVPDLWSECPSWQVPGALMDPDPAADPRESVQHPFTVSCANYQATSTKSLSVNQDAIAVAIDQALDALRTTGVAATRADVVAQGMGGILARRYIDDGSFLGIDNFNAGKINRLITMDTPHLGSRLADQIVRFRDFNKELSPDLWTGIKHDFLTPDGINIDNDDGDVAIDELGTASPTINGIGKPRALPRSTSYHAMVTTGGRAVSRTDGLSLLPPGVQNLYSFMEQLHPDTIGLPLPQQQENLIFGTQSLIFCTDDQATGADDHDLFVTRAEQQGGLADPFTSFFLVDPAALYSGHFNVQQDKAHTQRLVALLNSSRDDGLFAPAMPSPESVPRNNGCPLPALLAPEHVASPRLSQHHIAITSPAPGTTVTPGSTISVAIDTGGAQPEAILIASAGGLVRLAAPPFAGSFKIPAAAGGSLALHAVAFFGHGELAIAQPVNLNVNINATLTAIEVLNGNVMLQRPGRTQQVLVIGTYSDGVRRDITRLPGTQYAASSLTPVASVSATGLITALGAGNATIAIRNGTRITSINVKVGQPTCGDGVIDPGEACDDGNLASGDGCDPSCQISNRPPAAVCQSPTVCNDAGQCSANVTNLGAGSDPEGAAVSIMQSPAGPYAVGHHEVSVSVSDGSLAAQCVAELDVRDCEKPALACPADFTAECTGDGGALVTPPGADATDNCGDVTVQAPAAGRLPLGANTLTYTAGDASDNVTSCTTIATVKDTMPPAIACPAPTIAECTGPRQATVDPGLASASDSCTPPSVTQPGAGTYPLGTTAVTYTASDASANRASCETTVTVRDTTPPSIQCPAPTVAECTGGGQASVDPGSASALEVCTSATVSHPGAASYPLGQTSVAYTATDEDGNQASCATSVTVQDTTPPSITCPAPIIAECTGPQGAIVQPGQATSSDICTGVTVTGPAPGLFPRGTTAVTYTSSDLTGNAASCDSTIDVVDTTPPRVSVGHPDPLLPANHQYRTVSLDDCDIAVEDTCGGRLSPSTYHAEITCVTSNEPDNARGNGDGNTSHDIVILDDHTLELRAERDGDGDGRVYQVHFRVRDEAGNGQDGVCAFVVPHDEHCDDDDHDHGHGHGHGHDHGHDHDGGHGHGHDHDHDGGHDRDRDAEFDSGYGHDAGHHRGHACRVLDDTVAHSVCRQ